MQEGARLVAEEAGEVVLAEARREPVPRLAVDEGPEEAPGDDRAQQHGHVDDVRADHACAVYIS